MASADMCEHEWPGSGCKECFPPQPKPEPERFSSYLDNIMASDASIIRAELERLMGKIIDAQLLSTFDSPIGKILHR